MTRYDLDVRLLEAAKQGDIAITEELLQKGANPNATDVINRLTPLTVASSRGHLKVVQLLVKHGAELDLVAGDAAETALTTAAVSGHADLVEWLLKAGADLSDVAREEIIAEVQGAGDDRIAALLRNAPRRN